MRSRTKHATIGYANSKRYFELAYPIVAILKMIRRDLEADLVQAAKEIPAITITGPRQSGKTTLCRTAFPNHTYVTLEDPDQRSLAQSDARSFLAHLSKGAILDEVQRTPELLSYLQGRIDENPAPGRWILCGSHSFSLRQSIGQTLAGRTYLHELLPLSWNEISRFPKRPNHLEAALFTGGYPRIHDQNLEPSRWLRSYVATYLERDVRLISNLTDLQPFQRFVELCAGRTGQLLNLSSLANDCGISQPTAKAWFSVLEASYIAFHLPAFDRKLSKRIVRMPKLYFYDTGLVCWLLGIRDPAQIRTHPLRGALFETWVVTEIVKRRIHAGIRGGLWFYRDRNGREVDLLVEGIPGIRLIEAKSAATPSLHMFDSVASVRQALEAGGYTTDTCILYGGDEHRAHSRGRLVPWQDLHEFVVPQDAATELRSR